MNNFPPLWLVICEKAIMKQPAYKKWVLLLIGVFFIFRLFTAAVLELGNDESYYWLYSRQLQWNYFDHPPLIALWVRISTLNGLLTDFEAAIRLGSIVSCACATWFLFKTVSLIKDERAGWFAACLLNASFYAGLVAGLMVMPDSPQLFFWTLCLWQLARLLQDDRNKWTWVLFGVSAGLCIMSKLHGVFLLTGFVLFALLKKRNWLHQPLFYISILIALLITTPLLVWNLNHDFNSLRFHSNRVDITETQPAKDSFWLETVSQVIITNPVNFILIAISLVWFVGRRNLHPLLTACHFIALPFIAFVVFLSLFRDIWFHWTGPAFISLLPLAAVHLAEYNKLALFPRVLKWSTALLVLVLAGWPLAVHYYPGTYGQRHHQMMGQDDVTLDKFGWESSGHDFAVLYNDAIKKKIIAPATPVVCPTWWGAHIEYYFARVAGAPVIGLGDSIRLGQYNWLNKKRLPLADMDTALLIEPSIEYGKATDFHHEYYNKLERLYTLTVYRNGKAAYNFNVSRLTGWKGINGDNKSTMLAQQKEH